MIQILYRGKRIDNGEWVEGYYGIKGKGTDIENHYIMVPTFQSSIGNYDYMCYFTDVHIDSETLCQYTGLKDKNGKRIWENDIVGAWSEGKHTIGRVKRRVDGLYIIYPSYQKQEFWGLCPDENGKTTVEVIGNILDNPELLKGE